MNRTFLAAVASLALALPAGVVVAQDTTVAADAWSMSDTQRDTYDTWPADRRATYDSWPSNAREYYWSLTPEQTEGWWVLNDEQRVQIVGMTPEQRTAAWTSISAQINGRTSSDTSTAGQMAASDMSANASTTGQMASAGTGMSGNMQFVTREMAQSVAGSANAAAFASGDLPVCKKGQQDGCINSYEKTGRGTKPLSYWPGRPASEMPGAKPEPR